MICNKYHSFQSNVPCTFGFKRYLHNQCESHVKMYGFLQEICRAIACPQEVTGKNTPWVHLYQKQASTKYLMSSIQISLGLVCLTDLMIPLYV